jgi:DNA-binding LacI/PurR family transcriptional regulator
MQTLKARTGSDQLKEDIYNQVKRGLLKKNDRLLSEEKLAEHYDLGIKLVRKALRGLESEGIIIRKKRVGTFINTGNIASVRNIAVLEFDLSVTTAYHAEIFEGIERAARIHGCAVQVNSLRGRRVRRSDSELLHRLIYEGKIDGLLLLSWLERDEIESLLKHNIPFVAAGYEYRHLDVPTVVGDVRNTLDRAVEELVTQGHKRIGMITGTTGVVNSDVVMMHEKLTDEFEALVRKLGLYCEEYHKKGFFAERDGYWLMRELLDMSNGPTAVITAGNELTNGAIKALYSHKGENKIEILPLADRDTMMPRPMLKRPIDKIGQKAVEMLIDLINGKELVTRKLVVEAELLR